MIDGYTVYNFTTLFQGYDRAFGTGRGGWVHRPPTSADFLAHLNGTGDGIGIGPLREDGTCCFAAIDLDRPDFDLAKEMMKLLPGVSWLERSRSGNAHVLVFFDGTVEAWVARGIMRETLAALGERTVEVFPKSDRLLPGMVGNYLNLPYFGDTRPVVCRYMDGQFHRAQGWPGNDAARWSIESFVNEALHSRNNPEDWRKRARWLGVTSPDERAQSGSREFGSAPTLHMCAQHVITNRETNPVVEGHRAVVFFTLSKQLANWSEIDDDEALAMLALVNDASPDPIPAAEVGRIYSNVKRGQFTSLGCDDPLFIPYAHPDCPIAHG